MYICLRHLSLLICLQLPTLFETSQSPPVLPMRKGLGVDFASASAFALAFVSTVGSAFDFVTTFGSLFGVVSTSLLATDSFTMSDSESFQSSSRSSMLFLPAVSCAHVLPAVGYALVLPTVGFALVLPTVGFALVLLAVGYALTVLLISPCCWVCSSHGPRTRVASSANVFLLLTTCSLAVVPSLIPPASLCGSLRLSASGLLQHHYSALRHFVVVVSR